MKTAVQVRHPGGDDRPRAEVLAGSPCAVIASELGPVALFEPGEVIAYRIRYRRRERVFVFRSLDVDDPLAASVPGVRPRVRLLLELRTAGRTRRVRGLFAYLAKHAPEPSRFADAFYVRVGLALGGRLPAHKILVSLLSQALDRVPKTCRMPRANRGRNRRLLPGGGSGDGEHSADEMAAGGPDRTGGP